MPLMDIDSTRVENSVIFWFRVRVVIGVPVRYPARMSHRRRTTPDTA
jgi:hypothetical protein